MPLFSSDPKIVADLAREFVMSMRAWGSGDFLAALSSRPETERRLIVDELFLRLEALVRAEPTLYNNDYPVAHIMMRKISEWWVTRRNEVRILQVPGQSPQNSWRHSHYTFRCRKHPVSHFWAWWWTCANRTKEKNNNWTSKFPLLQWHSQGW